MGSPRIAPRPAPGPGSCQKTRPFPRALPDQARSGTTTPGSAWVPKGTTDDWRLTLAGRLLSEVPIYGVQRNSLI